MTLIPFVATLRVDRDTTDERASADDGRCGRCKPGAEAGRIVLGSSHVVLAV